MSGLPWFAGVTVDHLYEDCPSRLKSEATLIAVGWWDIRGTHLDPDGTDVCGACLRRYRAAERAA